jgi:hypothetical protein
LVLMGMMKELIVTMTRRLIAMLLRFAGFNFL